MEVMIEPLLASHPPSSGQIATLLFHLFMSHAVAFHRSGLTLTMIKRFAF